MIYQLLSKLGQFLCVGLVVGHHELHQGHHLVQRCCRCGSAMMMVAAVLSSCDIQIIEPDDTEQTPGGTPEDNTGENP